MAGWNRPNAANQPAAKKGGTKSPSLMKGVIVGAVAVLVGVVCIWMFSGGEDAPKVKPDKKRERVKAVTPAKAPKSESKAPVAEETVQEPAAPQARPPVPSPNANPGIVERMLRAQGITNDWATIRSNRTFKTRADQLLGMLTPSKPGMAMPPPPVSPSDDNDPEIRKALEKRLEATDADTDQTLAHKEDVQAMKDEFNELKKDGMTFSEYVKAVSEKRTDDAKFLQEARQLTEQLYADKGITDEEYAQSKEKINALLKERGLPEVMTEEEREQAEAEAAEKEDRIEAMKEKALKAVRSAAPPSR